MKASVFCLLCLTTAFLSNTISVTSGQFEDDLDNEPLPPIWVAPDNHGHMKPVLQEVATEVPLIGRPDGHEPIANDGQSLIGRPDGHEPNKQTEMPLIGRPDGHDGGSHSLIGRPDGHEPNYQTDMPSTELTDEDDDDDDDDDDLTSEEVISDDDDDDDYVEDDDDEEDGDEPLIRCKRPMCMMFCSFGFQTDETGCPVCRCLEDPCKDVSCDEGSICHSLQCADQRSCTKLSANCIPLARSCPEPMCADYCPNGYQHNKEGCMTCDCEETSEISDVKEPACPEPMCANLCINGYQTNSRGCMTCTCVEDSFNKDTVNTCSALVCELGQICRTTQTANEDGSLNSVVVCAPKPLCQLAQEMADMKRGRGQSSVNASRMFVPECEQNGAFKPMQCHNKKESECWCVDDRGKEIDGSRKMILSDDDKPQCTPNVTTTVHMSMLLVADDDDDDDVGEDDYDDDNDNDDDITDDDDDDYHKDSSSLHSDFLEGTFEDVVGSWLLIEKQYITVIKTDGTLSKNRITVELVISNDGISDLPSAIEHMKRKIRMGHCKFPLHNVVFSPDIENLDVEHKYDVDQFKTASSVSDDDNPVACHYTVYSCFGDYHILLAVSVMLLLFVFLAVFSATMVHRRRTRYNSMQFRHHKLENQYSQEQKNFVEGEVAIEVPSESVILVSSEKKIPIA